MTTHQSYISKITHALCIAGLMLFSPVALSQPTLSTQSKVAIPMTAAINAGLSLSTATDITPNTTAEHKSTGITTNIIATEDDNLEQTKPMTELWFEVERVSQTNYTLDDIVSNSVDDTFVDRNLVQEVPVTYAALPNPNRHATTSKIAVATIVPPAMPVEISAQISVTTEQAIATIAPQERDYVIAPLPLDEISPVIAALEEEQRAVQRRPTPSKKPVNAPAYTPDAANINELALVAPPVQPQIAPQRDASGYYYLTAPSKTPVAAIERLDRRSTQLPLNISAKSVLVIDQTSREILYSKNSLDTMPIASITKLMTAMVVLDAKQNLNQQITITSADIDTLKGTSSRLYVGAKISRRDLLHLSLMSSENRAAHALSRNYPGGEKAFIAAMNAKAQELGMTQTFYADASGLNNKNRSSARDLVWLVDAAYKYDLIKNLSTSSQHRVTAGKSRLNYTTSNRLIDQKQWDIGLQKTGYIREAGYCLVMQTQISGKSVIMVLLDADAKKNRFSDADKIRSWISA